MEKKPMIEVRILFDPETGALSVQGPTKQQVLCLGLLEAAKHVVMSPVEERLVQPAVVTPHFGKPI